MKTKEFSKMKGGDIDSKIKELKMELVKLYAQVASGTTPKKPTQIKLIRKNIARMLTVKNRSTK